MSEDPLQRILCLLPDAKATGPGRWQARCPAHPDRRPSLSVARGQNGQVLLHCHAGCGTEAILKALGLQLRDLFPAHSATGTTAARSADWAERAVAFARDLTQNRLCQLAELLGVGTEALTAIGAGWDLRGGRWTFPERDGNGHVVGIATRRTSGSKGFLRGGQRGLIVPEGLADRPDPVLVVEGPSDVAAAMSVGLAAVGRPSATGGAAFLADLLKGRTVLVLGERDSKGERWPGRDGAIAAAQKLSVAWGQSVRWSLPPEPHKDVRAWLLARLASGLRLDDAEARRTASKQLLQSLESLSRTVEPEAAREAQASPYRETPAGLVYEKPTQNGPVTVALTNFAARIVTERIEDDGVEVRRSFEVEACLCRDGAMARRFTIPASVFPSMNWPTEQLGAAAIVYAGFGTKDQARVAVQALSGAPPEQVVHTHTGWRRVGNCWCYLHAAGAIGPDGPAEGVEVELPENVSGFRLPPPPEGAALRDAVRACLGLIDGLAPDEVMIPLFASPWRAALGSCDFAIHVAGPTGIFKTELAALVQQHFGSGFDARGLPGSWSSTPNALEVLAFVAKDALFVVDDFAPSGPGDPLHRQADRLIRAAANCVGRQRLRADCTLRAPKPPRSLIVSTGEDLPHGQSLRARLIVIELADGQVDIERLTRCQQDAAAGLYAAAMAGFVRWLAPRIERIRREMATQIASIRQGISASHRRTPTSLASLALGLNQFLEFAVEIGAAGGE